MTGTAPVVILVRDRMPRRRRKTIGSTTTSPIWSNAVVLSRLRELHDRGVRISPQDLKNSGHADLLWACYRRFGSFIKARRAAKIAAPPRRVRNPPVTITAREALEQIRELAKERAGIMPPRGAYPDDLRRALIHHFGTLSAVRARLDLRLPGSRWSRARVIEELRRRHQQGAPISSTAVRADAALTNAIQRHLGGHRAALRAAGLALPQRGPRKWSPERLHAAFLKYVARDDMIDHKLLRRRGLLSVVYSYFGSIPRLRARIKAYQEGRASAISPRGAGRRRRNPT